jgi:hypothetical protein
VVSYWKSRIPFLSSSSLLNLAKDAEIRIGSHVAGGAPLTEYVEKQQALLGLIQDELASRES